MKKAKLILEAEYNGSADADHISDALHLITSNAAGNGMLTFDGMLSLRTWDAAVFVHETIDLDDFPDLEPEHLDDIIHELKSKEASGLNNAGVEDQVEYLLETLVFEEAVKLIKSETGK